MVHSCPASLSSLQLICLPARTLLSVAAEPPEWPRYSRCSYLHIVRASCEKIQDDIQRNIMWKFEHFLSYRSQWNVRLKLEVVSSDRRRWPNWQKVNLCIAFWKGRGGGGKGGGVSTNERPGFDHVTRRPMRGLKKIAWKGDRAIDKLTSQLYERIIFFLFLILSTGLPWWRSLAEIASRWRCRLPFKIFPL